MLILFGKKNLTQLSVYCFGLSVWESQSNLNIWKWVQISAMEKLMLRVTQVIYSLRRYCLVEKTFTGFTHLFAKYCFSCKCNFNRGSCVLFLTLALIRVFPFRYNKAQVPTRTVLLFQRPMRSNHR